MTLNIELSEEKLLALQNLAAEQNTTIEHLLETMIERVLVHKSQVQKVGESLEAKNSELYKRLAVNDVSQEVFEKFKDRAFKDHTETLKRLADS
ncbi:hypothetical protein KIH39_21740 [Telmatocola sphagniphila]|uniref:Uncharacterized protein n=1 Tax=Telmatocola sphagniphila TaxID=1123043 RepID=A0A8E6B6I0_9BACT|nr:hypothetical protein [Telmatocola sphagniphila]QVL31443.1 hypothetical protein KIH39_21740 [Telmatocola sphagniphila]